MARWYGRRGRTLHPQTSPGGPQASVFISFISICSLPSVINSYLHVNGFIHRDIKAANLLVDDDGTVLLGDLGVAAPLHDEDHTHVNDNSKPFRAVVFDPDVKPVPRHPRFGKRRSFVGTVGRSLASTAVSQDPYHTQLPAMLDGTRTHFRRPLRLKRRYLVLRYHSARVGTGACSPITRIFPFRPFSDVSDSATLHRLYGDLIAVCPQSGSRATHPRSRRRRAQVLTCIQGNRRTLPRKGPFPPVHSFPFPKVFWALTMRRAVQQPRSSSKRPFSGTRRNAPTSLEPYSVRTYSSPLVPTCVLMVASR